MNRSHLIDPILRVPLRTFARGVLSFRAPLMCKLVGIVAGTALLQLLNLIRIVTLYWIGLYVPGIFDSTHLEIWPTAFIIVAIVLFIGWIEWSPNPQKSAAEPASL